MVAWLKQTVETSMNKSETVQNRDKVIEEWQDAVRKVWEAEDVLDTARARRNRAADACEAYGYTPHGKEIPQRSV